MKIKYFLYLLFLVLLIQGCSKTEDQVTTETKDILKFESKTGGIELHIPEGWQEVEKSKGEILAIKDQDGAECKVLEVGQLKAEQFDTLVHDVKTKGIELFGAISELKIDNVNVAGLEGIKVTTDYKTKDGQIATLLAVILKDTINNRILQIAFKVPKEKYQDKQKTFENILNSLKIRQKIAGTTAAKEVNVENTPEAVAKAYYQFMARNKCAEAYSLLTTKGKETHSFEKFCPWLKEKSEFYFGAASEKTINGLIATIEEQEEGVTTVKVTHKALGFNVRLHLVNENGKWMVFVLNGPGGGSNSQETKIESQEEKTAQITGAYPVTSFTECNSEDYRFTQDLQECRIVAAIAQNDLTKCDAVTEIHKGGYSGDYYTYKELCIATFAREKNDIILCDKLEHNYIKEKCKQKKGPFVSWKNGIITNTGLWSDSFA